MFSITAVCRCCVLFPSTESKTVEELRSEGEASQAAHCEGNEKLLIILVDGTWKQAKRLQSSNALDLPQIPDVHCIRAYRPLGASCTTHAYHPFSVSMQDSESSG